jgi:hypothetical protein
VTEHEAVALYCTTRSQALRGAFRRGFRWRMNGGQRGRNPYRKNRNERGWGQRFWAMWDEGYRTAERHGPSVEET